MSFIILPDELLIEIAGWIGDIKGLVEFGLINRNCRQILTEDNHLRFNEFVRLRCMPSNKYYRLITKALFHGVSVELDKLDGLTNLTYLDCQYCNVTDKSICNLINLTYLNCNGCDDVTNKGICNLINLTYLNCNGYNGITDKGICKMINLIHLNCNGCNGITDKGICKLINLIHLNCNWCNGITDKSICKMINLIHLNCNGCNGITDTSICKLINLKRIDAYDSGVSWEMSRKINHYE
jgi:bacterioferritin-associated ferredoxin